MGRLANGPDGWVGVDFDRTLSSRTHDSPTMDAGPPVPKMVERVKKWLAQGHNVKIFTARVGTQPTDGRWGTAEQQKELIEQWCLKHIGVVLPVTSQKDGYMLEMWDDAAVAVEENTGRQLSPSKVEGPPPTLLQELMNVLNSKVSESMRKPGQPNWDLEIGL